MIKIISKFTYDTKYKNENGITVMALIVTIIVLLIISSVTIATLTGQDSLVSSVEKQRSEVIKMNAKQEIEVAAERIKLANASNTALTIEEFCGQLEERLKNNDENAKVTVKGEGYEVQYKENTFEYYYDYIEVTFDANGGSVAKNNKVVIHRRPYGELPVPVNEGYSFLGWYTEKTGGEQITETTSVTKATNHTLYARWDR